MMRRMNKLALGQINFKAVGTGPTENPSMIVGENHGMVDIFYFTSTKFQEDKLLVLILQTIKFSKNEWQSPKNSFHLKI